MPMWNLFVNAKQHGDYHGKNQKKNDYACNDSLCFSAVKVNHNKPYLSFCTKYIKPVSLPEIFFVFFYYFFVPVVVKGNYDAENN